MAAAGFVFSMATLVAVPGRILWGWIGSGPAEPGQVMAWLALGMAASTVLVGLSGSHWPLALIGIAGAGLSLTALSWHGVLLAEAARLAPEGMRGAATGGVLSFGQTGALLLPLAFAGVLATTGSYAGRLHAVRPAGARGRHRAAARRDTGLLTWTRQTSLFCERD